MKTKTKIRKIQKCIDAILDIESFHSLESFRSALDKLRTAEQVLIEEEETSQIISAQKD